ncbi:protein REVERSION-TO-ETHYLENE SENSITIVITY1 isoform X2 [Cinnamomum micranthum f. kanehirae]|uniref:Protein REVERSION-TO-ETHYLENE SENSITIVITY1 isoform X2 n=1 Tax=Cinnamomum micranthum f. kanehirae TaxID=337451 RepID=A0A443NGC7_9MAGN|nr:protein REVERSION-TO-ETHYLENE SENSITIVITY1 isoform X2 [Cinnamomum micranthum f. kanehirae]
MSPSRFSPMELKAANDLEDASCSQRLHRDMWPLDEVDPSKARFPCCIVWTPLPIVSWLAPFFGHVGICREDGAILDFSGSNFVNIDNFAFGSVARYLQLDREQCCFPPNLAGHTCKHGYKHTEKGASISWDDALWLGMQHYQHKSYNLFTCNCHSFVANCLNRVSYGGSLGWNVFNLGALILWKGQWVDSMSVVRSFFPFVAVVCLGVWVAGWAFLVGWASFSLLLIGWFLLGSYCIKSLIECD